MKNYNDSKDLDIELLDNNYYLINGEKIYAPNLNTAIERYKNGTMDNGFDKKTTKRVGGEI